MPALFTRLDFAMLLDGLAIACSLVLILFLIANRLRHGRLVLNRQDRREQRGFANQLSLQMIAQQSQRAYANLQHSLAREFEALGTMGAGASHAPLRAEPDGTPPAGVDGPLGRRRRYRMAQEMMARGEAPPKIAQLCALSEGELDLLHDLQQLNGQPHPPTDHSMGTAP